LHGKAFIDFQVDFNRLSESDQEKLQAFLAQQQAGMMTRPEMDYILVWLLNRSLEHNAPNLTTEERQLEILRLLLVSPQEHLKPTLGVSPFLLFVSRRARNRLLKQHGVTVEELERESVELSAGRKQFEEIPPGPDTLVSAETYNRLIIAHHKKVKRLGNLVGGEIGKALAVQASLAIEELSSPL
jgi:hypothetical protein